LPVLSSDEGSPDHPSHKRIKAVKGKKIFESYLTGVNNVPHFTLRKSQYIQELLRTDLDFLNSFKKRLEKNKIVI